MALAIRIKQQFGNVKIGVVVPDLPQFMGCNKFYKRLGLQQKDIAAINRMIPCFDCYVVLTEGMLKVMGVEKKPHVIVEGIYSNQNKDSSYILQNKGEKIILYTGGLFIRYGVKDLIEAFMKIEEDTYKLWLCGTGDAVDYIRKSSMMDNRIVYKGLLPKKDIIRSSDENVYIETNDITFESVCGTEAFDFLQLVDDSKVKDISQWGCELAHAHYFEIRKRRVTVTQHNWDVFKLISGKYNRYVFLHYDKGNIEFIVPNIVK